MPSARRPSSYRQYYCAKQGEFVANICFEVFLSVFNAAPRGGCADELLTL
jgi:hypothetical protein